MAATKPSRNFPNEPAFSLTMTTPRTLLLFWVATFRMTAAARFHANITHLCFPTVTRSLVDDELNTFEKLTNHHLRSEDMLSPQSLLISQEWQPHGLVNTNVDGSNYWFVIEDAMSVSTPFRPDTCWTVKLLVTVRDDETLPLILKNDEANVAYIGLLRLGMPSELFVQSSDPPNQSTTTTVTTSDREDGTTTTTTTTTVVTERNWMWLLILAAVLAVGSLAILAVWFIYLRTPPMRYLRKNESEDGTTDPRESLDHGDPDEEMVLDDSSCSSFCTS